ncbi:hypothetical protein EVAR_31257_1 [Eumeta japonica]|uniref:Uncharacterized protein n=1 Tax=Eumeta variegata TaxID=151549 RepID=A0A4C1W1D3_EUMVA|nr:hypothetical protein EVAR_31257_1 [Eumeta japonica]
MKKGLVQNYLSQSLDDFEILITISELKQFLRIQKYLSDAAYSLKGLLEIPLLVLILENFIHFALGPGKLIILVRWGFDYKTIRPSEPFFSSIRLRGSDFNPTSLAHWRGSDDWGLELVIIKFENIFSCFLWVAVVVEPFHHMSTSVTQLLHFDLSQKAEKRYRGGAPKLPESGRHSQYK